MRTCKACDETKEEWDFDLHIRKGELRQSPFNEICRVCKHTKEIPMHTFVIIKPDSTKRGLIGRIISRFEDADFEIFSMRILQKDKTWFFRMYGHLSGSVYRDMENFMLSQPIVGIILKGRDAVNRARKMIGCTDSSETDPGTIRGDFGSHPIRFNCVHASDSKEAVTKEILLFFGDTRG